MRRVLALRPVGAPPTGSLLETLFVQLRRRVLGSVEPRRQVEVRNAAGETVAFVDFATGWLVGRFTWDEIVRNPVAAARRLEELLRQAAARPISVVPSGC